MSRNEDAGRASLGERSGVTAAPRVATYSIVARDARSGRFGVAVQSHWFRVGPVVPWADAGVGAVATQSLAELSYGPKGLALMRDGVSAHDALDRLVRADTGRDVRQVAMIDRHGNAAAWTGPRCIPEAGHQIGAGFSVQANLMGRPSVWPVMAGAYELAAQDEFPERLLAALEAAEGEGGDARGRQSAALIVVRGQRTERWWEDRLVDLRVDDHAEPLVELRRLLRLHRAYERMSEGDRALGTGRVGDAIGHYDAAARLAPEVAELPFWQAVALFSAGQTARALLLFREVFAKEPSWTRVAQRLPAAGLLPADAKSIRTILDQAT